MLKERGYSLIIANSQFDASKEADAIETFINNNVEGIFLASSIHVRNQPLLEHLREEKKIALVLLEALAHHPEYNYVMIDDTYGMEQAIAYFIRKGHKKIGFISDYILDLIRKPMYFEALKRNGLSIKNNPLLSHPTKRCEIAGYEIMQKFLDLKDYPTAYLAGYDDVAIGAIRAAEERGLSIPEDIAIIGNDDLIQSSYLHRKLSTLSPPVERMSELGVKLMLDVIEGNEWDSMHHIRLNPNFIIRETA
jgi:DNA-binding LacI/PurR family transcriptional regulator